MSDVRMTFFLEETLVQSDFKEQAIGLSVTKGIGGPDIGRVVSVRPMTQFGRAGYEVEIEVRKTVLVTPVDLNVSMGKKRDPS